MKKLFILVFVSSLLFAEVKQAPINVKVFIVNDNAVNITKTYPAVIKAQKSVNIIARVSGTLEKRYFKEGSFVKKGEKLYQIEQDLYQANIDSSRANLNQAKALLVKATSDWERYKKLFENRSISASQRDQYYYNYQNAIANVKSAEAALTNAKIQYGYTQIKAPLDGIISITKLNEGNYVNANTLLTTITKIDPVYAEFSLPKIDIEKYLKYIKSNNVKFAINCQDKCIEGGTLNYISPTIDPSTDTLLLRVQFDNNQDIIVGQFTNINIDNIPSPKTIVIPEQAVLQSAKGASIYIVDEESTVKVKNIKTTGDSIKDGVVIENNLNIGDKIIISNISKVRAGAKVQIIKGKD